MKSLKVVIGIPSTGVWTEQFAMSLISLVTDFSSQIPGFKKQSLVLQSIKGSILPQLRERVVKKAIEDGATHVLFVDSDQTFPADTLRRLIAHNKPIVAANVATKSSPSAPTARIKGGDKGVPLCTKPESAGLERVWRIGTGVMLIDLNVKSHKGMEAPWFPMRWEDTLQDWVGEDWGFCEKLDAAGVPIYIDHDLSKQVGHIGTLSYGHDLVPWWEYEPIHSEKEKPVLQNRNVLEVVR